MAAPTVKTCQQKKILCVGQCILDIVTICAEYPQEDSNKHCITGYWQRGGRASNNCTVLRHLGCGKVEFLGMMSNSPAFFYLQEDCKQRGITIANCPTDNRDPPFSSIILSQATRSRTSIHYNTDFPSLKATHFSKLKMPSYAWVHFEGHNYQETLNMINFIHAYNKTGKIEDRITISIDLEEYDPDLVTLAELVNFVFIGKAFALSRGWKDMRQAVDGLKEMLEPRIELDNVKPSIVCTWGESGACCVDALGRHATLPAVAVKNVVDPLGAGDTFRAATIYALAVYKTDLPTAVLYGNTVAATMVGHYGFDTLKGYNMAPVPCEWGFGENE